MEKVDFAFFQSKITFRRTKSPNRRHCINVHTFRCHMRAFSTLCVVSLQVGVFVATAIQPVVAQPLPTNRQLPRLSPFSPLTPQGKSPIQPPVPPPSPEVAPSRSQEQPLTRYLLGPGDTIGVLVQRPPGRYILGPGDAIAVTVQRFPDLSFQAQINPDGNITVPLLGTVSLKGLSLKQAQEKIRVGLNRYVIDPIVTLALVGQRPEFNFQALINPEGNIVVPQAGNVSVQGLTLEEAQEKIRSALSDILVDQDVVAVSLVGQRPVQITISGEVPRPGVYPVSSLTPRVGDALLLAGGSTNTADLRKVLVRRTLLDGSVVSQTIDLYTPLQKGGAIPNLRLQDGDAIIVPRRDIATSDNYDRNLVSRSTLAVPQIRIRVLNYSAGGLVTLPLPNGSTFIDVLSGINLDTANLKQIALVRFDPERGRAVTQKLNAKKALSGDVSQNVPLQDNDVIVVGRNLIGRITNAINTVTQPFFNIESFIRFFDIFNGNLP